MIYVKPRRLFTFCLVLLFATEAALHGQHQTNDFSPLVIESSLPYQVELLSYDLGETPLPTLHSFAQAQWDGKWLLVGGRTNGLHKFTQNGFVNFPPASQNREIWVVDPLNGQSWHRSLDDGTSGLTTSQIDSLAVTNSQFYQEEDRLYVTGGYGYSTDVDYVTFDILTSINVPGLMQWTQGTGGTAIDQIRQIQDPLFAVTGGAMLPIGDRTHLVFGQDFQGDYTSFADGVYTNQVRSFSVVDDGVNLAIENVSVSDVSDNYRRRDLNVLPVIRPTDGDSITQELLALSGVFTPGGGAWTVPVEIAADGTPTMADPTNQDTFKQAMNGYHSAKLGLYSEASEEMHMMLFGGISLNYFDYDAQEMVSDHRLPFINQSTSVVIDQEGNYTQHLLPNTFPEIFDEDSGKQLHFGTNAEFMLADGINTFENGVIRMDDLTGPTTLGYILGGIAADQPNRGNTAASGRLFEVVYTPTQSGCSPANQLLGDLDGDGLVAFADFLIMSANFNTQVTSYSLGDVDCNGTVGFEDFLKLSANFGRSLPDPSPAKVVPETTGSALGILAFAFLALRSSRQDDMAVAS